jgi:hypothetical protein
MWADSGSSGERPMAGSCEHSYETPCSTKGDEFLNQMSGYQVLKTDCASQTWYLFSKLHHVTSVVGTWS